MTNTEMANKQPTCNKTTHTIGIHSLLNGHNGSPLNRHNEHHSKGNTTSILKAPQSQF